MLKGKVVVVVGGAGLLGSAFCSAAVGKGARVVIADVDGSLASKLAQPVESRDGGEASSCLADVSSLGTILSLIEFAHGRYGRIDAVVNCAYPRNINYGRRLEDVDYSDFVENTSLNLAGCFLVAQQFAAYFKRQGDGNIVNIGSIYGTLAPRFSIYEATSMTMPVEYAAVKAGVLQLTRYFAQYFKKDHIRCNCLSPGGILDAQPDSFLEAYRRFAGSKGMLAPSDLAGALLFLLSDESRFMTGQNLVVDDGFSL